jgi:hypothetical protein
VLASVLLLASCGSPTREPARPSARPSARETAQCHADLRQIGVSFRPLPDKDHGGGCGLFGAVQLLDVGVPVGGLTAVSCGEARAFVTWVRNGMAPAAYQMLGSELVRVDTLGSYACRNVAGRDRRSGHAIANAIDVAGIRLKDGRRLTVAADWNGDDERVRDFWRTLRRSACRRFGTVLSPDYNAAHADHLHLEDDRAQFCR